MSPAQAAQLARSIINDLRQGAEVEEQCLWAWIDDPVDQVAVVAILGAPRKHLRIRDPKAQTVLATLLQETIE